MYHMSAQSVDERMINVYYYYYFVTSQTVVLFVGKEQCNMAAPRRAKNQNTNFQCYSCLSSTISLRVFK